MKTETEQSLGYVQEFFNKLMADITWLKTMGGWATAIIFMTLFIAAIAFPDRAKQVKAYFLGLIATLGWFRRQYIGSKFESDISIASQQLNSELGADILPTDCKINWVREANRESFLKEGKVVVKLSYKEDKSKNYVNAVVCYLQKGLLENARHYISPDIVKSSELLLAKKLITKCDNCDSIRYFTEEVLNPILEDDAQLRECITDLHIMDNKGLFVQVFLPELLEYGNKLYPNELRSEKLFEETKGVLKFLVKVATKKTSEEIDLSYVTKMFNFQIMIIGKANKIEIKGIEPYIYALKVLIRNGYEKIYILSEGKKLPETNQIIDQIKQMPQVIDIKTRNTELQWPDGRKEKGVCHVIVVDRKRSQVAV